MSEATDEREFDDNGDSLLYVEDNAIINEEIKIFKT